MITRSGVGGGPGAWTHRVASLRQWPWLGMSLDLAVGVLLAATFLQLLLPDLAFHAMLAVLVVRAFALDLRGTLARPAIARQEYQGGALALDLHDRVGQMLGALTLTLGPEAEPVPAGGG